MSVSRIDVTAICFDSYMSTGGSTNIPELKKCPGSEVYHIKRKVS